jgi:CHAT domain-containing protein/tetratricopeptide (TPR) repeat protein
MTSLGRLYKTMGDFDKSELYYFKALELKKEISGESSSDYVSALGDLGGLYEAQGKYVEAEKCYRDVFELKKGSKNEMLPYNLGYGNLQFMMGNYDAALYYFEQAASYYNENSDKKNPNLIGTKNNIARVLTEAGRYAEAEKIYLECAEDRAEVLGKNHPDYATTLSDIANLYRRLGKFDLAFDYQEKALRIREEALGSDNFMISYSLENMGALRESQGLLDSALLHYDKALELRKQTIGQKNVYYNQSLFKKANIFFRKNDFDSALPLFRQVINYHIEEIMAFLPVLSDDERLSMLEKKQPVFSRFRDFCIAYANRQPELISDMFNLNMLTKNVVFSSSQKVKSNIQLSNDSSLIADYELWKMQKRTYAQLLQKSPQENEKSSVDLNEMLIRINELETSISRRSNIFSKSKATKVHSWEEVRNQLKKNEILVEVVRTARVTGYDSIGQETFKTVYALMFVTAETKNSPVLTVIENGNELESKFLNFYKNAVAYKADDNVSYAQFWKPVADVLQKMSRKPFSKVYFSPDGCYHQISLNTLKNPVTGKYLLEESNIFLIGSSRDLLVLQKSELSQNYKNCKAFIFGYPIYDLDEQSGTSKKGERSFSALQLITGQKSVVALLPGTKIEADNVEIVLRQKGVTVKNYKEREANEENFKKLVSPTFLHVATHGYFVPNKQKPNPKTSAEAVENLLMKNPFLRAGLLLSGCQNEQINDNDGILTAAEAMNLSLDDTEIVVLSACETGLGDIRNGEGVFGLQRAFRQAGAKSVVMSLWKVSDEATQLLMTDFYKNLFNGFDKESALKQAQLNLKKHFPEPYYWGAFVLTGE